MNKSENDSFIQRALQLASQRRGFCAPNPAVGAVVVKAGEVIGEGAHWACGHPHAEVVALQAAGENVAGSTLYVTLEPCSHHGRTPPCTDLIIRSGVREVIFAVRDPNPQVSGQGEKVLQQAGIICRQLPSSEVEEFYQSYGYWLAHRLPWVTIKLAISMDGKIAGPQGAPVALTGPECRLFTHQYRLHSDALLTTAETIIKDDPQFNVRLQSETIAKPLYILDRNLRTPSSAQIFQTAKSICIFHSSSISPEKLSLFQRENVRFIAVKSARDELDLTEVLARIGEDGCHDLWIEAGGRCFQSVLAQNLAQRIIIYLAPKILALMPPPHLPSQ